MEREMDMAQVSDGKKYGLQDMVKVGCSDCAGCSECCQGMEDTVVLDPLDLYRLTTGLGKSFGDLLDQALTLGVVDGLVLPKLKIDGDQGRCVFLNDQGRCRIHAYRPGICRLFPLGRIYEEDSFWYFLQVHECPRKNKTKVRVRKWIDTPEPQKYESFVLRWHNFLKKMQDRAQQAVQEEQKSLALMILKIFYEKSYEKETDFYQQFDQRMGEMEEASLCISMR
ncbi:MAG: YkgJ family cysteine cluster protein [Lachnospiraceae bacterium]|jgi:Fe-S-cluster containining protein|nr:YkgJ family cysteine cluster protein [Lachnospiraceae bacterium]MCI8996349.1 YkgJ family cysteine cluster protein [Lachnospiraceae bacterium]